MTFLLGSNLRGCQSSPAGRSALLVQLPALRSAARRAVVRCRAMASTGGPSEARPGASAAVSTSCNTSKIKRTPVILNPPRKPPGAHFRVLQWNVLADGLAQNGDFCRVHPDHLKWEYRKPLLIQEIMEANADIICLQELNHFEDLSQVLKELGYEGAFREKHASPALKYEFPPDGMAVFYRSGRFTCSTGAVEGRSFQDDSTGREQSQGYLQILLHDLVVGRDLLVVTTHLKAKDGAECEDMRYQQAKQLLRNVSGTLERLEKAAQEASVAAGGNGGAGSAAHAGGNGGSGSSKAGGNGSASNGAGRNGSGSGHHAAGGAAVAAEHRVPVVVTGDFNTLPGSKTCTAFREHPLGLMSLWEQRPIDATLSSGSDMDVPPPPPSAPAAAGSNGSNGATTAAAAGAGPSRPSEFSTWKFRVKGESKRISDYIYFSGGGPLRPLQRWRMLTEEEIGPTALPSPAYASDHVSLCCEFEWDVDADLEWAPRSQEQDWG